MKKYRKFVPHLLIIIFTLSIFVCDMYYGSRLNESVLHSVLISEHGIGEKTANKVIEVLVNSDLLKMNLRNPVLEFIKYMSMMGIVFTSIHLLRKDINKLANQDYEGHKNTQEFLMEVKDELKENRK